MKIDWLWLKWNLIKGILNEEIIMVADESTITKAGNKTFGVGRYYSGLFGRAVNGIQIITFSIVDVKKYDHFQYLHDSYRNIGVKRIQKKKKEAKEDQQELKTKTLKRFN